MPTGRPVEITRTELSAIELRRAAARSREADAARRMLALALVLEGKSRKEAAESCGMDRQTLRDWVIRYNDKGLPGLSDRVPPGPAFRLTPEQMAELATLVETGPDPAVDHVVRWRCADLRRVIAARWGVQFHERTVGKLLHRLGFAKLSVRPKHPKSDPDAQAEWEKKLHPTRTSRPAGERSWQADRGLVCRVSRTRGQSGGLPPRRTPGWASRARLRAFGHARVRGPEPRETVATLGLTSSAPSVPSAAWARAWSCLMPTPRP
jgi:transposase